MAFQGFSTQLDGIRRRKNMLVISDALHYGRVTEAGTWWKGIAYEAYSNTFSGTGGRSTEIAECPRSAGRVCTFLKVASQRKSDFEEDGAKYFT